LLQELSFGLLACYGTNRGSSFQCRRFHLLPTHGEFKALEGERLQQLQQRFSGVDYLIIDEIPMLGRKVFGQVDQGFVRLSTSCW